MFHTRTINCKKIKWGIFNYDYEASDRVVCAVVIKCGYYDLSYMCGSEYTLKKTLNKQKS